MWAKRVEVVQKSKIIIPKTKIMPMSEIIWSDTEQEIAQTAFQNPISEKLAL